jgi:hypothetical protein
MSLRRPLSALRAFLLAGALFPLAATAQTVARVTPAPLPSTTDPRANLRAGWNNAGTAAMNLELVANVPRTEPFVDPNNPGDFGRMNSDLAFQGNTLFLGNFSGIQIYDISNPEQPRLRSTIVCPGGQGDVSVHGNLLFMSVEETRGRVDCGTQGVQAPSSPERFRGVRIFDIRNLEAPRQVAAIQTCRGSHTHTLVTDPRDRANVYVYVSGTSGVRPGAELAGCAGGPPEDPNSAYFRVEVIKVPLSAPQQATVVNKASFLLGLTAPPEHGPSPADAAAAAQRAAQARAQGRFTVMVDGAEEVVPDQFARQQLAAIVARRGGTGEPTAADSAAFRAALPGIVAGMQGGGNRTGPNQCHDITAYPEVGLAGGACAGYGILLDIRDVTNPRRIHEVADENFAYWHSATFNNDGTKVIFTDEWGGGTSPRCRATDKPEWGANAIFTIAGGRMQQHSYYKLPVAQTAQENCVAHNGSLIPVPGRDIMAQAWYQGGVSIFDFTDPAHPVEIAYFDRGPMNAERLDMAGYWSTYWYNGYLYGSEIGRGLDVFKLTPSRHLSAAEIAAAEAVRETTVNPQHQTKVTWPRTTTTARAHYDQIMRTRGLSPEQAAAIAADLDAAQQGSATARTRLAMQARSLETVAETAPDMQADRMRRLAAVLRGMGRR